MYLQHSPDMSPSKPISIGRPSAPAGYLDSSPSSRSSLCAYPSWPSGNSFSSFGGNTAPSAFISDEDLFPEDIAASGSASSASYLLSEAPAPPRDIPVAQPMPLAPLYASDRPKTKRRRSSRKQSRSSKPMTPITESPEVSE